MPSAERSAARQRPRGSNPLRQKPPPRTRTAVLALASKLVQSVLSYDIELLSERIAEHEEERPALEEGNDIPSATPLSAAAPVVTDEDVRQMFSTLKDE